MQGNIAQKYDHSQQNHVTPHNQTGASKFDKSNLQHAADEKSILQNLQLGITNVAQKKVFHRKKIAIQEYIHAEVQKFMANSMKAAREK